MIQLNRLLHSSLCSKVLNLSKQVHACIHILIVNTNSQYRELLNQHLMQRMVGSCLDRMTVGPSRFTKVVL